MKKSVKETLKSDLIIGLIFGIPIFIIFFLPWTKWDKEDRKTKDSDYCEKRQYGDSIYDAQWKHRLNPEPDTGKPRELPPIPEELKFENAVMGLLDLYH